MDLILQFGTQSHAHRLVAYFHEGAAVRVFPPGPCIAAAAEELGPPRNHHTGPCLALLRDVRLAPHEFNAWLASSFVERSCTRTYWLRRDVPAAADRCLCAFFWGGGGRCTALRAHMEARL
jgi:hypothetical protein